ncbi:MAG TPA: hypothetical protein VN903_28665 [Polyangia bacterium]|nr:hypothetical protein [Polyangia bacterium]
MRHANDRDNPDAGLDHACATGAALCMKAIYAELDVEELARRLPDEEPDIPF